MPVTAKDILKELDKQQPAKGSKEPSAADILSELDKQPPKKKDEKTGSASPSASTATKKETPSPAASAFTSPFEAPPPPKITTKDGTEISYDKNKVPAVIDMNALSSRVKEGKQTPFDEDIIAMATGKSRSVVKGYLQDQYTGMAMENQEGAAKRKETLRNSIVQYNQTFNTKYNPDDILSSAEKAADFLKELKPRVQKEVTSEIAFQQPLIYQPDQMRQIMGADGKLTSISNREYVKRFKSQLLDPASLINQASNYVELLQHHVVTKTVEEDRKNGIASDKTIQKIAERLNPKEYNQFQKAKARSALGVTDIVTNPIVVNPFAALGDLKDKVFGTKEKDELLNVMKGEAEVKYNKTLDEIAKDKISRGILTKDDALIKEGQEDLKQVNNDAIFKYPSLLKQQIARDVSEEVARESGQLKDSETEGFQGMQARIFGASRADYENIMNRRGYLDNPKTKDIALSLLNNPSLFSDASYIGSLANSFQRPFKDLALSVGDLTGFRNLSDVFADRVKDQMFPEETSNLKPSAKVTRHIVNTTANLAGMMVIAAATEGAGEAGGLSTGTSKALGGYTSFGLPSFDASLKDSYNFLDNDTARYLYASMNAVANAEGGRLLDLGRIVRIPGVGEDFARLAKGLSEKTITKEAAAESLHGAANKYVDFAMKYGKNIVKGAATMAAFNIKDHVLGMLFGDDKLNGKNLEGDAANAFMDGVTGMSIIGAFGASADASKESNTTYKKFIYDLALHHDAAEDIFRMGMENGTFTKDQFSQKMDVVNTAKAAKDVMEAKSAEKGINLTPDQKAVYVANKTTEAIIRRKLDRLDDGPEKERLTAQANRLSAQSENIFEGLHFTPTLEPHTELFEAEKKYDEATDQFHKGEIKEGELQQHKNGYDKALSAAVTYPKKQGASRTTEGGASVIEPTARSTDRVSVQMPSQVTKPNVVDLVKATDPVLDEARNIVNAAKVDLSTNYTFQDLINSANNDPVLFKEHLKNIAEQGHDPLSKETAEKVFTTEVVNKAKELFPLKEEEKESSTNKPTSVEPSIDSDKKELSSQSKKDTDGQQKQSGRTEEVRVNSEGVQYNGRDVIAGRSRPKPEQDASRARAKEKISNPATNASLKAANKYAQAAGIPQITPHPFKPSDKVQQTKIAEIYPQLQDVNSPDYKETDLERQIFEGYKTKFPKIIEQYGITNYKDLVHKAYEQLAKEVQLQYESLPVKVTFHKGKGNYQNSAEMLDDVHNFNHMWVYRGGDDHTELGSKTADKDGLTVNDKFRAVHDYFGHSIEGYQFGKDGEENAWIEHSKMFSPLAQWALSSETRGQNSFVNYSGINEVPLHKLKLGGALKSEGYKLGNEEMVKQGEKLVREANNEFNYAEQKAVVLPVEHTDISSFHKDALKEVPDRLKEDKSKDVPAVTIGNATDLGKALDALLGKDKLPKVGADKTSDVRPAGEGIEHFDTPKKILDQAAIYFKDDPQIQNALQFLRPIIENNPDVKIDTEAKLPDNVDGYSLPDGRVQLNLNNLKDYDSLYRTAIHELIHAATRNEISKNAAFRDELGDAVKTIREALGIDQYGDLTSALVEKGVIEKDKYGASNEHELVAEVFSNKKFADYLKGIAYKGDNLLKTIIQKVIGAFVKSYRELSDAKSGINADNMADFVTQLTQSVVKDAGEFKEEGAKAAMVKPSDDLQNLVDAALKTMKPEEVEAVLRDKGITKPTIDALLGRGDDSFTGIKNALTASERKLRGLGEVEVNARRGFQEVWDNAKVLVETGQRDPRVMAKELAGKPRALDPEESAMLVYDRMRLYNEHEDALNALIEARKSGDALAEMEARTRMAYAEDEIRTNDEAARKTGYEQGLGLAIRRLLSKKDYSLANQTRLLEAEYGGELPRELKDRLQQYDKELKEANDKLEKYEEKFKQKKAEDAVAKAVKQARKEKTQESIDKIREERQGLLDQLRQIKKDEEDKGMQKMGISLPNKAVPIIAKLAFNYIKEGAVRLDDVVKRVHEQVKDVFEGITEREVRDAISGFGIERKPTEDEYKKQFGDLKSQMKLVSQIEDIKNGKLPEKKEGKKRSDEVKQLHKELTQAMREAGMSIDKSYKTPEERAQIALKSVKSRLKNQIDKLNELIKTGKKAEEGKAVEYDEEANALRAERDRLQEVAEEMESKDISPEEAIKKAANALQKQISNYEKKIKGNKKPTAKKSAETTPESEVMTRRLNDLKAEYKKLQNDSYEEVLQHNKLEDFKDRLRKKMIDLSQKMEKGEFGEPEVSKPLEIDEEAVRLRQAVKQVEDKFDREKKKKQKEDRDNLKKTTDLLLKWRRFAILSGVTTLGKLTTAAAGRMIITPLEELEGAFLARLPFFSTIAAQAPREGAGFNVKAEAAAVSQLWQKATAQDIYDIMKTGKGSLDVLYGKNNELPPEALDLFGQFHSALKVAPKRAEFFRSFEHRLNFAATKGFNPKDPVVQYTAAMDAYIDANRAIFMQDHPLTEGYQKIVKFLEGKGSSGEISAVALKFFFPIVKVPTNYVGEVTSYATGVIQALTVISTKGIRNLEPKQADFVMRNFKKGFIGLAVATIGYYNPDLAGGYYQPHEKRKKDDLAAGQLKLFGVKLPRWMGHIPLLEMLNLGSTLRRVHDKYKHEDEVTKDWKAVRAGSVGLLEEVPFFSVPTQFGEELSSPSGGGYLAGQELKSVLEPRLLQEIAEANDSDKGFLRSFITGEGNKRKVKTVGDALKSGIPGLREDLKKK